MSQNYDPTLPASGVTTFGQLYQILRDKFEALRSQFSGTDFPVDPTIGQPFFKVDVNNNPIKLYIYTGISSYGVNGWAEIACEFTGLGKEVIEARGQKASLGLRLDVSLNEDGTLKSNVAAYQSEWISAALTYTYIAPDHFSVPGDHTDTFTKYRRVKINHTTSSVAYSYITSSSYDSVNDTTTVILADSVIQTDLSSVDYSIIHSNRNIDSLPRNIPYPKIISITSNYTTVDDDYYILADASSGDIVITLTTYPDKQLTVKRLDASLNSLTITPSSGNIDGNLSVVINNQYEAIKLVCDGTNWWIV